jgi:hypothetical protein
MSEEAAFECHRIQAAWLADRANRNQCLAAAKALLRAEPQYFADLRDKGIPQLVPMVTAAREAGDEREVERIEAYLKAAHPPQRITGVGRV